MIKERTPAEGGGNLFPHRLRACCHGVTEGTCVVFDVVEKAAGLNVVDGTDIASIQCCDNVLRVRAEVEVIREIPDLVIRGRGIACDKGGKGTARATNKLASFARLRGAKTYMRGAERAGTIE